jgi:SAM-dependent methyltransferase
MRELIKDFVALCVRTLPLAEPIYEFGALQVPGQEGFADLRPLFPGRKYVGSDVRAGPGVDVLLDLHHLILPAQSVGTALIMDTLEHVEYPHQALNEIHRIMQPQGVVIISSVMHMEIHEYPHDYWRFTPDGFRVLLHPFDDALVASAGREEFPHTVIGIGFRGSRPPLQEFTEALAGWRARWEVLPRETLLQKWTKKLKRSSAKRWQAILRRI